MPVMNPQKRFIRRSRYLMSLSFYCSVYCGLYLGKDCAWREHFAVFVRAVDADELRVALALLPVDVAYLDLELDVGLVDVLCALEVLSVLSASLALEL